MPEFAAHDFVACTRVATDVDAADVGPLARVDEEGDRHRLFVFIDLGDAVDVGESVSEIRQFCRYTVTALHDRLAREWLATAQMNQRKILVRLTYQITGEANVTDCVDSTLVDIDRDVDVLLVRRDRDLGRVDLEIDVAAVEIVRTQCLEIARQFRP